jgi:para-aminobenzoate synthetase / 4-amino-4-deoxychorismate lyase
MEKTENTLILQDHLHGDVGWIKFSNPEHIVIAETPERVQACLDEIDRFVKKGYYAAGYLSYEASSGIDSSLCTKRECGYPLLWFGIYSNYESIDLSTIENDNFSFDKWEPNISREQYEKDIAAVKKYIRNGDTYQVNFTLRLRNTFSGNPLSLFKTLSRAQSSEYCAFVDIGDTTFCSASPELFFEYDNGKVSSRPMKGTVKRGVSIEHDEQMAAWLKDSIKNRAENVMIVDMIRNDMGRFADTGSVHVDKLFSVERYPTVFQMTSTVTAKTGKSAIDVVRQMFPCASITGAPKVRTMEIINELEADPRGIYTGSIGYFSPDSKAQLNVAIRTAVINNKTQNAEYGVGGGIVWDSSAQDEYDECKLKAAILTYREPPFELLETLSWDPENGFLFLEKHITRLEAAARYFNFIFNGNNVLDALQKAVIEENLRMRIRLTLDQSGKLSVTSSPVKNVIGNLVALVKERVATQSRYIYNKTTNRLIYDNALCQRTNVNDVILINKDGMITESCIANVVIRSNGQLLTPSLECGLLNGVYRRMLLDKGIIKESMISKKDLLSAEDIYLVNSVRGCMKLEPVKGKVCWTVKTESLFDSSEKQFANEQLILENA